MTLPPPERRRTSGFTLVEVLVGALVLGIFISFVYGVVISAFKVRDVVQSTTSAMSGGTMAIELVARDMENAFLFPLEGKEGFKAVDEGGGRTKVDLVTTVDSRGQEEMDRRMIRSDISETGYRLRQGERGFVLYRREQIGVDDKPLEGGDFHKVIEGVQEFSMEFFEEDPADAGAGGGSGSTKDEEGDKEWDSKDKGKLPRAAKIVLVIEGRSTNPDRADEMQEFRFTRWVLFPGAADIEAPPQAAGNPQGPGAGN